MTRNKTLNIPFRSFLLSLGLVFSLTGFASGTHDGKHQDGSKADCAKQEQHKHAGKTDKHHHDCKEKTDKKSDGHNHSH